MRRLRASRWATCWASISRPSEARTHGATPAAPAHGHGTQHAHRHRRCYHRHLIHLRHRLHPLPAAIPAPNSAQAEQGGRARLVHAQGVAPGPLSLLHRTQQLVGTPLPPRRTRRRRSRRERPAGRGGGRAECGARNVDDVIRWRLAAHDPQPQLGAVAPDARSRGA